MKQSIAFMKPVRMAAVILLLAVQLFVIESEAQVCSNPNTTIYGLTATGSIYPISVSNANVGAALNPVYPGYAAAESNAMGYNPTNGKFYYFKRNPNMSSQEFCVFDPGTMTYTILASAPTSDAIHCGCVTKNGTGYYAVDTQGRLFYYNIVLNTWTTISSNIRDANNSNVSNVIKNHPTGDMAVDGNGDLWILCCGGVDYGLYKLNAPLPVTPQATVVVAQRVAPSTATPFPNADVFAGIAFNSSGQIYLSSYFQNRLYRLENNLSITFIGTFNVTNVGNDLTSCNFPLGVLPIKWQNFDASLLRENDVKLEWEVTHSGNTEFSIQHSTNGSDWQEVTRIIANTAEENQVYSYTHSDPANGTNYYRIRMHENHQEGSFSETLRLNVETDPAGMFSLGPNPANDLLYLTAKGGMNSSKLTISFIDLAGRIQMEKHLMPGENTVNINTLKNGLYIVNIISANGEIYKEKIIKR